MKQKLLILFPILLCTFLLADEKADLEFLTKMVAGPQKEYCLSGDGDECVNLGMSELIGLNPSGKPDFVAGLKWFSRGCDLNNSNGCYSAAQLYANAMPGQTPESGVVKDYEKVFGLYKKSCFEEAGGKKDSKACASLGALYAKGLGVEQNQTKAAALYKISCAESIQKEGCIMAQELGYIPSTIITPQK